MSRFFYIFLSSAFFLSIYIGVCSYYDLRHTSDGFHYFSGLYNLARGFGTLGLYEGVLFENLLGEHNYLILHLFLPLVAVFKSPLVLLIISIIAHFATVVLIFEWSKRSLADRGRHWPWLLSLFYFIHPMTIYLMFSGGYLFFPDALLPAAMIAIAWAFFSAKYNALMILIPFAIFIKEEYIVSVPSYLLMLYLISKNRPPMRKTALIVFITLAAGLVSYGTMKYFRSFNVHHHVNPYDVIGQIRKINTFENLRGFFNLWQKTLLPIIALFILGMVMRIQPRRLFFIFFITVGLFTARLYGQMILYDRTNELWWSNSMLVPVLFVGMIAMLNLFTNQKSLRYAFFILSIAVLGAVLRLKTSHPVEMLSSLNFPNKEIARELEFLAGSLPNPKKVETVASPNYYQRAFMERSFTHINFFEYALDHENEHLLSRIHYVILSSRHEGRMDLAPRLEPRFKKIGQTASFSLYQNQRSK